jgi:hypothetical protein
MVTYNSFFSEKFSCCSTARIKPVINNIYIFNDYFHHQLIRLHIIAELKYTHIAACLLHCCHQTFCFIWVKSFIYAVYMYVFTSVRSICHLTSPTPSLKYKMCHKLYTANSDDWFSLFIIKKLNKEMQWSAMFLFYHYLCYMNGIFIHKPFHIL